MKRCLRALLLACALWPLAGGAAEPAAQAQVMVMLKLPTPHFRADAHYAGAYRSDSGRGARRRIAQALAQAHGLTLVADWPMPVLGVDCYVLALPPAADPARVAAQLAEDTRVEWAQPVTTFHALGIPDPLFPVQPAALQWHLDELHRAATGRNVTVAVIDSGVDEQHPDLAGQLALRENFVDGQPYLAENHGTAVAGIIAARADNGIGIRGVAPGARVLALRACREEGGQAAQCDSFSLGKALHFAIMHEPNVINFSLTGPPDRLLQRLIEVALGRGIAVVGAADPLRADGGFPAAWPGVLAVGADSAPGRDVPTTLPGGRFGMVSGASFSAAHVAGLLALVGELRPGATPAQRRSMLAAGLLKVGSRGVIDACAALAQAAARCVCSCAAGAGLKSLRAP
ncbi:MAG: S8 family serine peptidase [Pseudomonadota bacterium]